MNQISNNTTQKTKNFQQKLRNGLLFVVLAAATSKTANAQAISEVITDYNGFWKTSASAINPVKPDNHNNLLSFSFNGTRYSTGVNDQILSSKGLPFTPGVFRALPMQNINAAANSNTKIGLGAMIDGVANGASNPAPSRSMPQYLNDGVNGLDLGTCVANLPAGTMFLSVSNVQASSIGDGIPDILVTQVADPSSSSDRYAFTDINGARVGNYLDINLTNITPVGNWTADFYEATGSTILSSSFTKTDRPIRMWAADFSAFGINASNIASIAYFKIDLSGSSDISFVAYNTTTLNVQQILPAQFSSFNAKINNDKVDLSWETINSLTKDRFVIESSVDGNNFQDADSLLNTTNASSTQKYQFSVAASNAAYYRIRQVDMSGSVTFSRVVMVSPKAVKTSSSVYPNPASSFVNLKHNTATGNEKILVYNLSGSLLMQSSVSKGSNQTRLDIPMLRTGSYQITYLSGNERSAEILVVK
ncbi:MAG: T9SS type A sorting domain-containing protein [Flavitalea sp.]